MPQMIATGRAGQRLAIAGPELFMVIYTYQLWQWGWAGL